MLEAWRRGFPVFEARREIIAETLPGAARTKSIGSICVPVGATNGSDLLELTETQFPALIRYSSNSSSAISYKNRWAGLCDRSGGGGGILPEHPKKFSVAMVKLKSFVVNKRIVKNPFCQCHWEI
jgi:hypothetical protein